MPLILILVIQFLLTISQYSEYPDLKPVEYSGERNGETLRQYHKPQSHRRVPCSLVSNSRILTSHLVIFSSDKILTLFALW